MISKKSAVSATRHDLQDATQSNKPRKMSESVCLYRCGEAASAPSPMETQFNGYFFFVCFVLPVATTVVQRTPTGEKSFLQPPGVSMGAPPGLLHTLSWFGWKGSFPGPIAPCARLEMVRCFPAPVLEV